MAGKDLSRRDLDDLCLVPDPEALVQQMAGCETMPAHLLNHWGPLPDLLKLVLQDKIDSAETIQSASLSWHNVNAHPPKYAVFHFDNTVSKSSHKSEGQSIMIGSQANLQIMAMLQSHGSSHCAVFGG